MENFVRRGIRTTVAVAGLAALGVGLAAPTAFALPSVPDISGVGNTQAVPSPTDAAAPAGALPARSSSRRPPPSRHGDRRGAVVEAAAEPTDEESTEPETTEPGEARDSSENTEAESPRPPKRTRRSPPVHVGRAARRRPPRRRRACCPRSPAPPWRRGQPAGGGRRPEQRAAEPGRRQHVLATSCAGTVLSAPRTGVNGAGSPPSARTPSPRASRCRGSPAAPRPGPARQRRTSRRARS